MGFIRRPQCDVLVPFCFLSACSKGHHYTYTTTTRGKYKIIVGENRDPKQLIFMNIQFYSPLFWAGKKHIESMCLTVWRESGSPTVHVSLSLSLSLLSPPGWGAATGVVLCLRSIVLVLIRPLVQARSGVKNHMRPCRAEAALLWFRDLKAALS